VLRYDSFLASVPTKFPTVKAEDKRTHFRTKFAVEVWVTPGFGSYRAANRKPAFTAIHVSENKPEQEYIDLIWNLISIQLRRVCSNSETCLSC
jgi:hypothetical protein